MNHKLTPKSLDAAQPTLDALRSLLVETLDSVEFTLDIKDDSDSTEESLRLAMFELIDQHINRASALAEGLFDVPISPKAMSLELALEMDGSTHFSGAELRDASKAWPVPDNLLQNLRAVTKQAQVIRERLGLPLHVRSAWRPNDNDSQHRFASALDLDLPPEHRSEENIDRLRMVAVEWWSEADGAVFGQPAGLGFYHRPAYRIHIDIRHKQSKGHRFWHRDLVKPYLGRYLGGERAR